jgi:hypothetical protein
MHLRLRAAARCPTRDLLINLEIGDALTTAALAVPAAARPATARVLRTPRSDRTGRGCCGHYSRARSTHVFAALRLRPAARLRRNRSRRPALRRWDGRTRFVYAMSSKRPTSRNGSSCADRRPTAVHQWWRSSSARGPQSRTSRSCEIDWCAFAEIRERGAGRRPKFGRSRRRAVPIRSLTSGRARSPSPRCRSSAPRTDGDRECHARLLLGRR